MFKSYLTPKSPNWFRIFYSLKPLINTAWKSLEASATSTAILAHSSPEKAFRSLRIFGFHIATALFKFNQIFQSELNLETEQITQVHSVTDP